MGSPEMTEERVQVCMKDLMQYDELRTLPGDRFDSYLVSTTMKHRKAYLHLVRAIPEEFLALTCCMRARRSRLSVQYFTMSGSRFGNPVRFKASSPVLMMNLVAQARSIALRLNAPQSRYQRVRVLIQGSAKIIPDQTVVWSRNIRRQPSKRRLRRKTDMAQANLNCKLAQLVQ